MIDYTVFDVATGAILRVGMADLPGRHLREGEGVVLGVRAPLHGYHVVDGAIEPNEES